MYPCPCCHNETFPAPPEKDIGFICPICWWENDPFIVSDDEPSDQNHGLALRKARNNYNQCGISAPRLMIDWAASNIKPWNELILMLCEKAETFEIHCWNEEIEEINIALQYGTKKNFKWEGGTVIEGMVTDEFKNRLSALPKPQDTEIYDKKTPFFSLFFDNGFSSEHYGTEIHSIYI